MLINTSKPNLAPNVGTTPYGDFSRATCRRPTVRPAHRTITIAEGSMDDSADRLAPPRVDKTHEILKAFVAPVAHESDAVTKDPRALVMAQSVYAAFGDYGATGGLTRNQIEIGRAHV